MSALPTIPRWPATKTLSDFFNCTVVSSQKLLCRQDAYRGCLRLPRIALPFCIRENEIDSLVRCNRTSEHRSGPNITNVEGTSGPTDSVRSEERRVGKEGRWRWWRC